MPITTISVADRKCDPEIFPWTSQRQILGRLSLEFLAQAIDFHDVL
jgi:hypothetical protein